MTNEDCLRIRIAELEQMVDRLHLQNTVNSNRVVYLEALCATLRKGLKEFGSHRLNGCSANRRGFWGKWDIPCDCGYEELLGEEA